jgi:hypothetical protein
VAHPGMNIRNVLICTALALAPACSKKGPEAEMDKMMTMMEDIGNAIDASGGDCGKMADGLNGVMDKYKGDIKEMKAAAEKLKADKEKSKELMQKYGERMKKVMPKMMGMMKCADDPKIKALQGKFKDLM